MGIGHVAVGLGLKRAHRELNAGILIFAALFADFLLGWFVLAGWEGYQAPPDYAGKHYLLFTFPWSHGLLPDIGWAALFGALVFYISRNRRAGVAGAVAVISHYPLDGIEHVKGLPLAGTGSIAFGLGLWRHLPLALAIEVAMAAIGLALYLAAVSAHSRARRAGMMIYVAAISAFMLAGQAASRQVPSREDLVIGWIAAPVLCGAVAFCLDQPTSPHAATRR